MSVPMLRVLLILALALAAMARADPATDPDAVWAPYQRLLDRHLQERRLPAGGLVSAFDYRAALAEPGTDAMLAEQSARLAAFDPGRLDTRARALAFWINAYNFFMIRYLLEHPAGPGRPVTGVRDYGSLVDPFALFKRTLFDVGGKDHSLQEIELEVLLGDEFARRGWKDARVHFMVNCASVGCPPLRKTVYTAANVEEMMAENTRLALDTPLHLSLAGKSLRVTSLFDWYRDDFVGQNGSVEAFIRTHGSALARARLDYAETIEYIDYDWSLNSPENFTGILLAAGAEPFE